MDKQFFGAEQAVGTGGILGFMKIVVIATCRDDIET